MVNTPQAVTERGRKRMPEVHDKKLPPSREGSKKINMQPLSSPLSEVRCLLPGGLLPGGRVTRSSWNWKNNCWFWPLKQVNIELFRGKNDVFTWEVWREHKDILSRAIFGISPIRLRLRLGAWGFALRAMTPHVYPTSRCHKREFLLKFSKDRRRYMQWLYQAQKRYGLAILNYMVT